MGQLFQFRGSIGAATIETKRPKLKHGFAGVVEIKRTEGKRTRNAGDKIFVEFIVLESNNPEMHPLGTCYSWGRSMLDAEQAARDLKRFLAAVAGINIEDKAAMAVLEPHMDNMMEAALVNPENMQGMGEDGRPLPVNALIGRRVRLETDGIKTSNGRDFMVHYWSPV